MPHGSSHHQILSHTAGPIQPSQFSQWVPAAAHEVAVRSLLLAAGICSIRYDTLHDSCGRRCHRPRPLLRVLPVTQVERETDPRGSPWVPGPQCPSVRKSVFKHCLTSNTIPNVIAYLLSTAVYNKPTKQDELV